MSAITLLAVLVGAAAVFMVVWNLLPAPEPGGSTLERRLSGVGVGTGGVADPMSPYYDPDEAELAKPVSERLIQPMIASVGKWMVGRTKDAQLHQLRILISQAGSKQKPETLLAQKLIFPVVGVLAGVGFGQLMGWSGATQGLVCIALGAMMYFYPTSSLKGKVKKRSKEMRVNLPGVLDLLTISMEAGLSMDGALMRVCESEGGILALEFQKVLNEIRLGRPRSEALLSMAERNDVEEMTGFIRAIVQAEPLGVSIANVLRIQSEDLRRIRRQRAEEAGHRAPVLMLLPMMGCIFPCVFIILLGPAVLAVIGPAK